MQPLSQPYAFPERIAYRRDMATRIDLLRGDITEFHADAIVNAANSTLFGGGGVDGAIHRVGGPAILAETQRLRETQFTDGLPAGQVVSTNAGNLPAKWVIHTVGPVYSTSEDRSEVLESCYVKSMELADLLSATSVAFPAISAGSYGWPLDDAARIAIESVQSTDTHVEVVTFVLHTDEALVAFQRALG
jgi:O-acetyl-ADP-ribose deacetylase (regulator of RNase III)